ncbi:uracil phosphoribosyltransferase [Metamycoplasma hominis]|uniref:Uracil phosphoribosyltransferase n=1 Tax=Metamycoplasma hominis TaxID=2098 RepID=UPP_METHO|nr:uracil phosphoribosyltransferase [Metamycoplasma hominis]P43049.1 RecName: Full=Uracil phosphoribosyltransferase; AltName: Full=UMP pyrophosphorylase; AltName: Full=UPRTase [Metamycoplasma hominis]QKX31463.1 uracil phosphoribosyltransferase [Metamycoplasma hominis]CAA81647.1 uracil phosphoribosyltransferase [Metamycoplasma hominis]
MVKIFQHPLINAKLTTMRSKETSYKDFRDNLNEIASLMVYETLRDYQTKKISITTPMNVKYEGETLDREIVIIPILRAGLGMLNGIMNLVPQARVGHIGMYRNEETNEVVEYFFKIPEVPHDSYIIIVDPMLATGSSACDAIAKLDKLGFNNIKLVCLVGVQQGIDKVTKQFPNVDIYLASKDEKLNEHNYILPGLGDAGDRIFGTKIK